MAQQRCPKKHVLSFRITEKKWQRLQTAAEKTGCDVSTLLRQSLNLIVQETHAD
jgi:hypothetical protein